MNSGPHRCGASTRRNQRIRIEARRRGGRRSRRRSRDYKVRPAVVIASATYLTERPDVLVGILTTKVPNPPGTTDHILLDWRSAGLRAESCFRAYVLTAHRSELTVIGHLSACDWDSVRACVRAAFAV